MKVVLQKYIASSGYCSRRKAEELIRDGKVEVNGDTAELGQKVSESDKIVVAGKSIQAIKEKIYIKLNKPRGYTCTNRTFDGEKNVFELLNNEELNLDHPLTPSFKQGGGESPSLFSRGRLGGGYGLHVVGRLDKNSHGLVILTNDGDFTEKMTHPRYEHEKEYLVTISDFRFQISDFIVQNIISNIKKGVDIGEGDGVVRAKDIKYLGDGRFKIILTQGKKRQIRRMFESLDYTVSDLERVRLAKIVLGDLKAGEWEEIKRPQL